MWKGEKRSRRNGEREGVISPIPSATVRSFPFPISQLFRPLKLLEITVGIKRVQVLAEGEVDKLVLILKEKAH